MLDRLLLFCSLLAMEALPPDLQWGTVCDMIESGFYYIKNDFHGTQNQWDDLNPEKEIKFSGGKIW